MNPIKVNTIYKKLLADTCTPVGIYLRLRDRYRDTILLESGDYHSSENSFSIIAINPIASIEVDNCGFIKLMFPDKSFKEVKTSSQHDLPTIAWEFMQAFKVTAVQNSFAGIAQSLFGYTSYDAIPFFEKITLKTKSLEPKIPLMRYRLYQYVIVINHYRDEMYICENQIAGITGDMNAIEALILGKDTPVFPFQKKGEESNKMSDDDFKAMVDKAIKHCYRGDIFQMVLSKQFSQKFTGDEFNVYRALRSVNPSPYLFYFDYGDYRLMGSSPESQLVIKDSVAICHPIAGTIKRSGDAAKDKESAMKLLEDPKENAEHVMLVDLARNDLSRHCNEVKVNFFRQVHYYSHVIHLVSEVAGNIENCKNPFRILGSSFPAGTLSGAPKYKALCLIDQYEPVSRGYYGGCIGYIGFNGSCNHAIMIRTILSMRNNLFYQAGAGIVASSKSQNELNEVNHKVSALRRAIELAETLTQTNNT